MARFHRIAKNNPPREDDFLSKEAQGKRRPPSVSVLTWAGVSMFDTSEGARKVARQTAGRLGHYISTLEVPDEVERKKTNTPGHYDFYAPAAELLAYVRVTVGVESEDDEGDHDGV